MEEFFLPDEILKLEKIRNLKDQSLNQDGILKFIYKMIILSNKGKEFGLKHFYTDQILGNLVHFGK